MSSFDNLFKLALLDTFKRTVSFFEKYSIHYYACGGTAIGAVRHGGIIPWDDDVDLYVHRSEYNKILSLKTEIKDYSLEICAFPDKGYNHSFMKIIDCNSTVWEQEDNPVISGVWVDIFPLDEVNKDTLSEQEYYRYKELYLRYQRCMRPNLIGLLCKSLLSKKYGQAMYALSTLVFYKPLVAIHRNRFANYEHVLQNKKGNAYVCYCEGLLFFYDKKWFDETVEMDFADFKINLPKYYHEYLTSYYGDYMTPPPADQQVPYHGIYYTNLKERLSIDEIKDRIKSSSWKNNPYENVYIK